MLRFIVISVISLASVNFVFCSDCKDVKCPPTPKHYEEFNCIPMKEEGKCCPTQ